MTDRELMQQALDALERWDARGRLRVMEALHARLAQPEPEPVAWKAIETMATTRYKVVPSDSSMFYRYAVVAGHGKQQIYIGREVECQNMASKFLGAFLDGAFAYQQMLAAPPQREWQGLTDEDLRLLLDEYDPYVDSLSDVFRSIEAKLKEKNT